ncbi:MAG: glycerophosphodiester phosphodiesterase family protein [Clostridia bacterium]
MKDFNIYDSWLVKTPIAHRGLHDEHFPENSVGAFKKAIDAGYAIETDLHITTDNVIVVFHDNNLKRITGIDKDIDECSYDELKEIALLGGENEKIPTLEGLLKLVDGKVPLLIEIKDHKDVGKLELPLRNRLREYNGEFAIQSFNPFIVRWFKHNAPDFIRGQLASYFTSEFGKGLRAWSKRVILRNCMLNGICGAQFTSYDTSYISRRRVRIIRRKMPLLMWTVRSQKHLDKCGGMYDNIIFEDFIPDFENKYNI